MNACHSSSVYRTCLPTCANIRDGVKNLSGSLTAYLQLYNQHALTPSTVVSITLDLRLRDRDAPLSATPSPLPLPRLPASSRTLPCSGTLLHLTAILKGSRPPNSLPGPLCLSCVTAGGGRVDLNPSWLRYLSSRSLLSVPFPATGTGSVPDALVLSLEVNAGR